MTLVTLLALAGLAAADEEDYRAEKGTGHCALILTFDGDPYALAASPDGRTLAVGAKDALHLVSFADGKLLRYVELDAGYIRGLAYAPDGSKVAAAAVGGLFMIDAATGKVLWKAECHVHVDPRGRRASSAYGAAFSRDGAAVVSVSQDDGKVMSWSVADGSPRKAVDSGEPYLKRITNAGDGYVVSDSRTIIRYDAGLGEVWRKRGRGLIETVAASPSGEVLAVGSARGGAGIGFLDAGTGESRSGGLLVGSTGGVKGIAFTPDAKYIIGSTTRRGVVKVFELAKGSEAPPVQLDEKYDTQKDADKGAVVGLDGKVVAVGGDDDDQLRIYRLPE